MVTVTAFENGQRVRILGEPFDNDDPPVGTIATVVRIYTHEVRVEFPGGTACYHHDELEAA